MERPRIEMVSQKPIVVYLHRYPPELESIQWYALEKLLAALTPDYDIVYASMAPASGERNAKLRQKIRVLELPFAIDQTCGRDKWLKTFRWYWHFCGLMKQIRAMKPALIICKETLPFIPGLVVKTGIPTLIGTNDWWWSIMLGHLPGGQWLANRIENREVRCWNRPNARALVSTKASGAMMEARGMAAERIVVINEPHNPGVFHPLTPPPTKSEMGLDERRKTFAICGIIRGGKGYDQLLDWWKIAITRHPDWQLVIIGGAGGEAWCRREIAKRSLQNAVHMTGWLPTKEDVNRWLNVMDAILVHRRNSPDNQGIITCALLNGLATGRPVVATGLPGFAEIIRNGVDGFLYDPDSCDSFIAALEQATSEHTNQTQVGYTGRARATECFDPNRTVQTFRALIDKILNP